LESGQDMTPTIPPGPAGEHFGHSVAPVGRQGNGRRHNYPAVLSKLLIPGTYDGKGLEGRIE
jgi:hypothetical protein